MGSSIWLVVLVPVMAVYAIFGGIKGAIFGYPQAEINLPYDEANGTVWEYDGIDDPYIGLDEVKVDGDEQIFVFSARENDDEEKYEGSIMQIVFTDRNGNEKAYYCNFSGSKFGQPAFYPAEECITLDITVTAKKPKKNAKWKTGMDDYDILVCETEKGESCTFTAVITPDKSKRTSLYADFEYVTAWDKTAENVTVWYGKNADGEYAVTNVRHETWFEKFLSDLTGGLL
ncbi:MAG: hypothetical protein IJA87_05520 [Clostridia bacterium]|nr:hypothetical protein [Clostridia bacterium]